MRPLHLTPAGVLGSIGVLIVVAVCTRLGFWQLDRRGQRLERNAAIAERLADGEVTLSGAPRDTTGLLYRRAEIEGYFDNDRAVVLAGRSHGGRPGAHLLTPLRAGNGAILVNRGWLPTADPAGLDLDPVTVEGHVVVEGVMLPFPDIDVERASPGFQRTWFRFHGESLRAQLPYRTAPLYLRATARPADLSSPDTAAAGLPVILGPPDLDEGPHLSYAIQWFSFAAIFLVGWGILVARRERAPG